MTTSFLNRTLTDQEQAYADAAMAGDQDAAARLLALLDQQDTDRIARLTQPGALAASALWYATVLAWPVFPLRPGDKRPLTQHGFKDATTSEDQVRAWWEQTPDANIGLPTGHAFDVIDVDSPAAITAGIQAGLLPGWDDPDLLATVMTPRGWHLYVTPQGVGNDAGFIDHIDYRGAGGYVVAPPSTVNHRTYQWDQAPKEATK